jgi:hypothetical protein
MRIEDRRGDVIYATDTAKLQQHWVKFETGQTIEFGFAIAMVLRDGDYTVTCSISGAELRSIDFPQPLLMTVLRNLDGILWAGVANLKPTFTVERLSH